MITTRVLETSSLKSGDIVLAVHPFSNGNEGYMFKLERIENGRVMWHSSGFNHGKFYYGGFLLYKVKGENLKPFWSKRITAMEEFNVPKNIGES